MNDCGKPDEPIAAQKRTNSGCESGHCNGSRASARRVRPTTRIRSARLELLGRLNSKPSRRLPRTTSRSSSAPQCVAQREAVENMHD